MSASASKITFRIHGIGDILRDGGLHVPQYQRPYAWGEKNVQELLTDIGGAIAEGPKSEYFLGSVVILGEDQKLDVVDGQQRLATTLILVSAIRDYLMENGDEKRAENLQSQYLLSEDLRTQEVEPKIRLGSIDHDFFLNYVLHYLKPSERRKIKPTRDSHKKLKKASEIARKHIAFVCKTTAEPTNTLLDWVEFITDRAQVIRVGVPDTANAFTIFETLNDRGLELAISDLLKNFIFKLSGDRIDECVNRWQEMTGSLAAVDAESKIVEFIRHIWSSRNGLTRERVLFDEIRKGVTSKQASIDLSTRLASGARLYAGILTAAPDYWSEYGETTRRHMETLNLLRMTQVRPLLLAVLSEFSPRDVSKTLKAMVSWAVRFYILGQLGSGPLETFYADHAKNVSNGTYPDFKTLNKAALKSVPTDSQFQEKFETATTGRGYLSRYYLRALENTAAGSDNPELLPNADPTVLNLEHVLPQKPGSGWNVSDDLIETHLNRIGNLVLLSASDNSSIGNGSFESKKGAFEKSKLKLTKKLSSYSQWTRQEIEERQKELAVLAVKTWSIR